jgi:nucleotide-binding universal stress UspA family protein
MKIVVGYVKTPESRAALDWAIEQSKHQDDVHVIVTHSIRGGKAIEAEQEEILTYRKEMDAIEKELTHLGIPHTIRRLIRGMTPAEDLCHVVAEEHADVVAIGLHQRSRAGKLLLGSDGRDIILSVPCPVLSVKAPVS